MPSRRAGLWRHPDFLRLWAGQTISQFGTFLGGLTFTAILWLHVGAVELSVLAACQLVPGFAMGLVAGVWVDRLRRRPILIAADIGRTAALAAVPLAAVFGVLRIEHLYVVSLVVSALTVTFEVAYEAYLPTLVEAHELVEGNSKLTASASVAEFAGFGISGWLVQWFTAPAAVAIDAATFLWSAAWIGRIRASELPPAPAAERQPFLHEALEGIRLVARHPLLRPLAATHLTLEFFGRFYQVLILLYLNQVVGFSPGVLGVVFAVGGLTALGGAALAGRAERLGGLGTSLVLALIVRGIGGVFIPLTGEANLLGFAFLVMSQIIVDPAYAFYEINQTSLRQAVTPVRLLGRMNASMRVLDFGAMLAGVVVAGALGQTIGPRAALWIASAGTVLAVLIIVRSAVFRLREMPVNPVDEPAPLSAGA